MSETAHCAIAAICEPSRYCSVTPRSKAPSGTSALKSMMPSASQSRSTSAARFAHNKVMVIYDESVITVTIKASRGNRRI